MAKSSPPPAGTDRYEVLAASAPHKRKQGPKHHSRSYPRGVGLDFRKLPGMTLISYIDQHGEWGNVGKCVEVTKEYS